MEKYLAPEAEALVYKLNHLITNPFSPQTHKQQRMQNPAKK
jgi:hypothetical protein